MSTQDTLYLSVSEKDCQGIHFFLKTYLSEAAYVEHEILCMARGVGGENELVKHRQQLPVQLFGHFPIQFTWNQCSTQMQPIAYPHAANKVDKYSIPKLSQ